MTLGRVTQLPASRGQAGYRVQARFAFRPALANEAGMPLVLLGRAEENSASLRFASDATAVTALVIACRLYPHKGSGPRSSASADEPPQQHHQPHGKEGRESLGAQSPDPR
jgi:hypothetical protein